ncbi:MAG TPA: alcohol dehydrogenase [Stellaceae bacterium]|jgi:D-arabinose 1-dehydrogenase-like Zn-dependent alcohol dehydrogenase|nr:alcohol dehydrogenase [Stellaceae bacterium]
MRAMQIIEWGKPLEARDYPDPVPQGEEVLLRVEAAGVCHSDVHIWDGHFDLGDGRKISLESRGVNLPFTMGHEIAGEVVALGPQASGVAVGDKVVAYPWIGCGECAVCQKGEELLCLNPRTLGTRKAGGYATHVIVPHARYLLPHDGVPQDLAATYTCSGITALSALKKTLEHVGPDDHLVIIGAGGVGGSAIHIAQAVVNGKVIVADIDPQKRAQARQMGAVATIDNSAPDAVKQIMQATNGGGAAAIDFVGAPKTMEFGVNILRKGGKLVMVGLYGGSNPISTVLFPFKMMTVEGSYVGTLEDLRELLALGKAGKIPPIPLEHRHADQASEALRDLKSGGKVRGRVVLRG